MENGRPDRSLKCIWVKVRSRCNCSAGFSRQVLGLGQQELNEPLDNMANFREIYQDPMSDGGIERLKELLKHCMDFHPQCYPPYNACLPTRVIDVGDEGTKPRLYLSQGEKQDYAALSHCWGSSQLLTTTRPTILARQTYLNWQDLPKTFQDAMRICHTLGIRYIWIDSVSFKMTGIAFTVQILIRS